MTARPGTTKLRVAFLGSPDFAVPSLEAVRAVHDVVLVVSQPDQPKGRGQAMAAPAVKVAALAAGLPVLQPKSARSGELEAALRTHAVDLAIVVAYGRIVPRGVLDAPRLGCVNVHGSLLPRWRGAAPIQRAVLAGDTETGVSIMQLDEGMDTGPVWATRTAPIGEEDTAGTMFGRLAPLGAALLLETLPVIAGAKARPAPQDEAKATHAPMLDKAEGLVAWDRAARVVRDQVRGCDPWPGAFSTLPGASGPEPLKLFGVRLAEGSGAPGEVLGAGAAGLVVACGQGAVAIAELQAAGRKRLPAKVFLGGRPLPPGTRLGA